MADICPFCLSPNAENMDSLVVYEAGAFPNAGGFPAAMLPLLQAAIVPLQHSLQDAVSRGLWRPDDPLPKILAARMKLYECPACSLRYRLPAIPIDVKYRSAYLRPKPKHG